MPKTIIYFLQLLFFLMISMVCKALNTPFRTVSTVQLPSSEQMSCLYFDHSGLMWIGTTSGLKSWDGYRMTSYRSDVYTPRVLPNNAVVSIVEDHDRYLWVGTRNGLARFDRRQGTIKTYHLPGNNRKIIYALYVSRDGTLWVGTNGGLSFYDRRADKFINYGIDRRLLIREDGRVSEGDRTVDVKSVAESPDGRYLYFGTWRYGVLRMKRGSDVLDCYRNPNGDSRAFSVTLDSRGRLWVGTWAAGLMCIENPETPDFAHPRTLSFGQSDGHCEQPIYNMVEDRQSNMLLLCRRNVIDMVNLNDVASGIAWREDTPEQNNAMTFDRLGNIWLQKRYTELCQIDNTPSMFKRLFADVADKPYAVNSVFSICSPDDRLFWLGLMPYGIALYDRTTGKALFNKQIPALRSLPDEVLQTAASSIRLMRDGSIWMASNSYGIIVIEPGRPARIIDVKSQPLLPDNYVNTLTQTADGAVWAGTRQGLIIFGANGRAYRLRMRFNGRDITYCDIRNIAQSRDGAVWLSTENEGILRIRRDSRGRYLVRQYSAEAGRYGVDDASACLQDGRGVLWAISNSGGLFRYDPASDTFEPVSRQYHLFSEKVYAINEDASGNLWLTTDNSLICLTFENGQPSPRFYAREDGIGPMLFPVNSTARHGSELYFGSGGGFIAFTPDRRKIAGQSIKEAPVVVTDIAVDERPYADLDSAFRRRISADQPSYTRRVTLPASATKLAFDFSVLDYTSPSQNKYAYQLEGYNDRWQHLTAGSHRASFENLPSGTYKLHLKAAGSNGIWQELPYTITVSVLPPWWASWWAYLLYAVLASLAVYGITWWYKEHMKTRNRLSMAVIFTNITHELLTPLTVISASVDDLRHRAPQYGANYDIIQGNISRLVRLLRQILEVRKSQAGQLRLRVAHGDIGTFISSEADIVRPLVKQKGLTLTVDTPPAEAWFDPDKLDTIIQNLLSNSIKYASPEGHIAVTLRTGGDKAVITVADDGIGISKEKMRHLYQRFLDGDYRRVNTIGTGIGLSLTRDLVDLHHGRIHCDSEEGRGTTFTITLPTAKSAYAENEIDETITAHPRQTETPKDTIMDAPAEVPAADAAPAGEKDHSVLLVEDNAELLTLMQNLLSSRYNVYTARDGQKALNVIGRRELDIIVSDVMMPVMDGIELTRTVKNNPDTAQLPVVLLTARTSEADRNQGLATGADAYLTKPFKLEELQIVIDNIIANRERVRRKFSAQTDFKIEEQHYSSPDEVFIKKAVDCVKAHLDDTEYDRDTFASDMCVSSSTLYNKLRAITGQNVTGFINSIRLKEACRIARQNPYITITELSAKVGFSTPKYFSKCFKKEFGMLLKEYIEHEKKE